MLDLFVAGLLGAALALAEPGAEQQSMQAFHEAEARHLLELDVSRDIFNDDDVHDVHQAKAFPGADSTGTRRQEQEQEWREQQSSLQPRAAEIIDVDASSHGSWSNLVYIKIPKTASSTFAGVLHRVGSRYGLTGADSCAHTWGKEPLLWAEHASYAAVKDKVDKLKEKSKVVTLVRDPVDRCLSHYYYTLGPASASWSQKPSTAGKLDFMRRHCSNYQTAFMGEDKHWHNLSSADEVIQRYDYIGLSDHFDESAVLLAHTLGVSDDDVAYISIKIADGRDAGDGTGTAVRSVRHPPFHEEPPEVKRFVASREWKDANAFDYAIVKHAKDQLSSFFHKADARNRLKRFIALRNREVKSLTAEDGTFDTTAAYESKLLLDCRFGKNDLTPGMDGGGGGSGGGGGGRERASAAAPREAHPETPAHETFDDPIKYCEAKLAFCTSSATQRTTAQCKQQHAQCLEHASVKEGSGHASNSAAASLSRRAVRLDALRAEGAATAAAHGATVDLSSSSSGGSGSGGSGKGAGDDSDPDNGFYDFCCCGPSGSRGAGQCPPHGGCNDYTCDGKCVGVADAKDCPVIHCDEDDGCNNPGAFTGSFIGSTQRHDRQHRASALIIPYNSDSGLADRVVSLHAEHAEHAAENKTDCDLKLSYCLKGNRNQTTGECNEAHRHCVGVVKKKAEKAKEGELEAAAAQAEKDAAIAAAEAEREATRAAKAAKADAVKELYSKVVDPRANTNCGEARKACEAAQTAPPASKARPLDLGCLAKYKACAAREARMAAAHEEMMADIKEQEKQERAQEKEAREKEKAKKEAAEAKKAAKEAAATHLAKAKESVKKATAEAKEAASSSSSSTAHTAKAKTAAKAAAHAAAKGTQVTKQKRTSTPSRA